MTYLLNNSTLSPTSIKYNDDDFEERDGPSVFIYLIIGCLILCSIIFIIYFSRVVGGRPQINNKVDPE